MFDPARLKRSVMLDHPHEAHGQIGPNLSRGQIGPNLSTPAPAVKEPRPMMELLKAYWGRMLIALMVLCVPAAALLIWIVSLASSKAAKTVAAPVAAAEAAAK